MGKRILMALLISTLLLGACSGQPSGGSEVSGEGTELFPTDPDTEIFPEVQEMKSERTKRDITSIKILTDDTTSQSALAKLSGLLADKGVSVSDSAETELYLGSADKSGAGTDAPEGEGYSLNTRGDIITLRSAGARGQYYAVLTFAQMINEKQISRTEITDSPDIPVRGVIEGFYGVPWSHADRISIIKFAGEYKMNTYIYAPKDDPKHRELWRELYTDDEKVKMTELIDTASDSEVDFVYAISPGLDFNYEDYENELQKLIAKCDSMYNLGVRSFALLLDDIPYRSESDARNHARLTNDFRREFFADHTGLTELICVFVEYFDGYITEEYTHTLASLLNKDVIVMWTGPGVTSLDMNASDFARVNAIYGRKMMLWWNYPVNDYCTDCLLTDGVRGLSSNLDEGIRGFVSNPMNQAEASKIPLFTIADFLWNTDAYSYAKSYAAALKILHPDTYESVRTFAELTYSSISNGKEDSQRISVLLDNFITEYEDKGFAEAGESLLSEFQKIAQAAENIKNESLNAKFLEEVTPWLDKTALCAEMGVSLLEALKTAEDEEAFWQKCSEFFAAKEKADKMIDVTVSGSVLKPFFSGKAQSLIAASPLFFRSGNEIMTTNLPQYSEYPLSLAADGNPGTYFWSAVTPHEINGDAYFMIDLGEAKEIKTVYAAMGADDTDKDRFYSAVLEASLDGSEWSELLSGEIKHTVSVTDTGLSARYVRLRCTDNNSDYWVKLREFSVNADDSVSETVKASAPATPSCSLEAYQDYRISNLTDGDASTFFWANASATKGFWVTLDLGKEIDIYNIALFSGVHPATTDYIRQGIMQYSADGVNWTDIGTFTTPDIILSGLSVKGRYVRYLSDSVQDYWFACSEFSVNTFETNPQVSGDVPGEYGRDLTKMLDGDPATFYKAQSLPEPGSTAKVVITAGTSKVVVLQSAISGAKIYFEDNNGKAELGELTSLYNAFTLPSTGGTLVMEWQGSEVPQINEILRVK